MSFVVTGPELSERSTPVRKHLCERNRKLAKRGPRYALTASWSAFASSTTLEAR
jgi:hypothetical protein